MVEFSSSSKLMVVNFNPRLVWAELESRALAALGLPLPSVASTLDTLTAALTHARTLQQVCILIKIIINMPLSCVLLSFEDQSILNITGNFDEYGLIVTVFIILTLIYIIITKCNNVGGVIS